MPTADDAVGVSALASFDSWRSAGASSVPVDVADVCRVRAGDPALPSCVVSVEDEVVVEEVVLLGMLRSPLLAREARAVAACDGAMEPTALLWGMGVAAVSMATPRAEGSDDDACGGSEAAARDCAVPATAAAAAARTRSAVSGFCCGVFCCGVLVGVGVGGVPLTDMAAGGVLVTVAVEAMDALLTMRCTLGASGSDCDRASCGDCGDCCCCCCCCGY